MKFTNKQDMQITHLQNMTEYYLKRMESYRKLIGNEYANWDELSELGKNERMDMEDAIIRMNEIVKSLVIARKNIRMYHTK